MIVRPLMFIALALVTVVTLAAPPDQPNIVFILADDLGYGDLGCYGQKKIRTPVLDKLAGEGLRFRDAYAGATVCAPSRCSLMTGLHGGHARIRGNKDVPLRAQDLTVAEVLKSAGYETALIGKWGLGEQGSGGEPSKKGFDYFFGFTNQTHAHNSWPEYLWRNAERVTLGNKLPAGAVTKHGEGVSEVKKEFANDLFVEDAVKYLGRRKQAGKPFFLYFSPTAPHANNEGKQNGMEVTTDAPYTGEAWPQNERNKAALVTWLDSAVGKVLAALKENGLEENTLVVFTSDNGPHKEGGSDPAFFNASGPLRGIKRALYEGGIRVPYIVRWPGKVAAGKETGFVTAFWDFLPTAAELAGAKKVDGMDGQSIVPTLLGKSQEPPAYLYFEFHERGFDQAIRQGDWKAVRHGRGTPIELYNLREDVGETKDVAGAHGEIVRRIEPLFTSARVDSAEFPVNENKRPRKQGEGAGGGVREK
ncbi:MAG TPA: arylsulfatase [Tepidisphaeraceae bacterium]|nr:arylsulfatase [Tepidisphaeraceae bacterium]